MKVYYDDGECGQLVVEILPNPPDADRRCKVQCIPFSDILNAVLDYRVKNHLDNPEYEHFLIVTHDCVV